MTADPGGPRTEVEAAGDRSIAVGHDAIASIFATGDHNRFFIGQYEQLADAYLKPWALYRELELERFTGREWLEEDLKTFLGSADRGYFILEGDVGVGKTTFLAWLAQKRGYLHHFVHLLHSERDAATALRNLCAQLIRTWDLNSRAIGGVLPAAASRADFFNDTLYEASRRRDQLRPGEPIVIVVDGLNEVDPAPPPNQNVLSLPSSLPSGVYFVVSQRSVYVRLATKAPRRVSKLNAAAPENLEDMRRYIADAVRRESIRQKLETEGVDAEEFKQSLLEACGGVWNYLYYLMADLEAGARAVTELDTLPTGLWQYYAQYWQSWQEEDLDQWRSVYQPLLSTISAARQNLPAKALAGLAGLDDVDRVASILDESWRPFLQVDDSAEEFRYGILHPSLRDFMEGRVDLGSLTSAEHAIVHRMARATRAAHSRIADRYLDAWGGLESGLPGLREPRLAMLDGGYGLHHLAEHLIAADRADDLHRLLWIGWSSNTIPEAPGGHVVNAWREAHETANTLSQYVNDVSRAWELAETTSRTAVDKGETPSSVTLELRYALLTASVNSMAANVPSALLLELMRSGRFPVEEAIAYARLTPDPLNRAQALLALGRSLPEPQRSRLLSEALGAARAVDDEQWRTAAVTLIAPYLSRASARDGEAVVNTIVDNYWFEAALGALDSLIGSGTPAGTRAPDRDPGDESWYDPALAVDHALTVARAIEVRPAEALARLVGRLPENRSDQDLQKALTTVRTVQHDRWRSDLLTALAAQMEESRDAVLEEALAAARAVGDSEEHGRAMAAVSDHLARLGRNAEAIETAETIPDPYLRTEALAALSEKLSGDHRNLARQATLASLEQISGDVDRARILMRHHALSLVEGTGEPDPALLGTISDDYWRGAVAAALIPSMDDNAAARASKKAFQSAAGLRTSHQRSGLLTRLAPVLTTEQVDGAAELLSEVAEPDDRGRLASGLAARLAELGRAGDAVTTADAIEDEYWRAATLTTIAVKLADGHDPAAGIDAARRIPYLHWKAEALVRLVASGAGSEEIVEEALAEVRAAPHDNWKATALARLAPHLPEAHRAARFDEAVEAAEKLEKPHDRWYCISHVAGFLAAAGLPAEALELIEKIDDHYWKADLLLRIAPALPERLLDDAVELARGINHQAERARVFGALVPRFGKAVPDQLHQVWSDTLHLLASGTRQELLLVLPGLLPAFGGLGGPGAMVECARIVESVRRWWP